MNKLYKISLSELGIWIHSDFCLTLNFPLTNNWGV